MRHLGDSYNLPGSEVRRVLATSPALHAYAHNGALASPQVRRVLATSDREIAAAKALPTLTGTSVANACFLHLTVLPAKPYTSHYLLKRNLEAGDVMNCTHGAGRAAMGASGALSWARGSGAVSMGAGVGAAERAAMLAALPRLTYDIDKIWCKGRRAGCLVVPRTGMPSPRSSAALHALDHPNLGKHVPRRVGRLDMHAALHALDHPQRQARAAPHDAATQAVCASHRHAAHTGSRLAPLSDAMSGNASELPPEVRRVLHRAVASAWDCNTVILLFATGDFVDLALNFMQAASSIQVTNFVLVAMDAKLGKIFDRFDAPPALLLPRVASGEVMISKLNVIGERQRFGLRVLESGFNVLFADLDAIFLRR